MAGKKISQLPNTTLPTMDGLSPVVLSGTTYNTTLGDLRQNLVDSGSHIFTGSQTINGNLVVNGITPMVGSETGSLYVNNSGSIDIARFIGDHSLYTQVKIQNKSNSQTASSDLVIASDTGTEQLHYVNLGINSSTYDTDNVGGPNDSYLLNSGNNMFIGTLDGTGHNANLIIFSRNNWREPQIFISGSKQIGFNTQIIDPQFQYEFSGSLKLDNDALIDGSLNIGSVNERIIPIVSGGTGKYELDYNSGSIFYLTSSVDNNIYNVVNVPTTNNKSVSVTFVVKQEDIPFIASSYEFDGESITVNWANGDVPSGNLNKTDVIGLTALRVGESWNVLGVFTTFG